MSNVIKMSPRFWQRWGLALILTATVMLVLITPFNKLCECTCLPDDCPCKQQSQAKNLRVRDIIIYNSSELANLSQKVDAVRKRREQDTLLRDEFLEQIAHERQLREEIQSLKDAIKMGLSNAARLKHAGWIVDCVTWERKWETDPLDIEPHNFTTDPTLHAHEMEADGKRLDTFVQIFEKRDWPAEDPSYQGLQASGPGAILRNAQGLMAALHVVVNRLKENLGKSTISLLDLPCGDFQFMSRFLLTRNDVEYTGADIVPGLLENHRKQFADLPRTEFIEWDIVKTPLNRSFDLVLCRDMLQHLYRGDAMQALYHISRSQSSFLLATTFPGTTQNNDDMDRMALGSRKVSYNLELPPFLLESPICTSYDWNVEHIALWPLPLQQKSLD